MADVSAIDLRVPSAQHLRALWLDGFPDGGVFVPGLTALPAAAAVIVRVVVAEPKASTTLLRGTVAWRRLHAGAAGGDDPSESSVLLRPGSGIAFDGAMRSRLLFLERIERGSAVELRAGSRYPTDLAGELMVRDGERALPIRVEDVGTRGARVRLPAKAFVGASTPVRLWLAWNASGASSFAPLPGRVVWVDRVGGDVLGVQLDLGSKEDRLHWARVFSGCQQDFERHFPAERRVG